MKGLIYGIAISFVFTLTACSEAQFSTQGSPSQKNEGLGNEQVIPVEEVPQNQLDDYVEVYKCSEEKKRSCGKHDSEDHESPNAKKALVCHVPNGNVKARHEICISAAALKAHINRHGNVYAKDYFGPCKK